MGFDWMLFGLRITSHGFHLVCVVTHQGFGVTQRLLNDFHLYVAYPARDGNLPGLSAHLAALQGFVEFISDATTFRLVCGFQFT